MSTIVAVKMGDATVLATDSRAVNGEFRPVTDARRKIFDLGRDIFYASTGYAPLTDRQVAIASDLVERGGFANLRELADQIDTASVPLMKAMLDRSAAELQGANSKLHEQIFVDGTRSAHSYVLIGISEGCSDWVGRCFYCRHGKVVTEKIFSDPIGPGQFSACCTESLDYDSFDWARGPVAVAEDMLDCVRKTNPHVGGAVQMAMVDKDGGHWVHQPPAAASQSQTNEKAVPPIVWTGENLADIIPAVPSATTASAYLIGTALTKAPTTGKLSVNISSNGPLYADVNNALNVNVSADFVVSGGVLTQSAVNLGKAYNFDTTGFQFVNGKLAINEVAVNQLIAGSALFLGTTTFAVSGGGQVQIGAAGITLQDTISNPQHTVTIASSGVSIASPAGSVTAGSSGISITNGTLTLNRNGVSTSILNAFVTGWSYAGIQVLDNTSGAFSVMNPFNCAADYPGTNPASASVNVSAGFAQVQAGVTVGGSTYYVAGQVSTVASSLSMLGPGGANVLLNINSGGTTLAMSALPSSNPGAGSKQFWYDPSDGNRVKYAA